MKYPLHFVRSTKGVRMARLRGMPRGPDERPACCAGPGGLGRGAFDVCKEPKHPLPALRARPAGMASGRSGVCEPVVRKQHAFTPCSLREQGEGQELTVGANPAPRKPHAGQARRLRHPENSNKQLNHRQFRRTGQHSPLRSDCRPFRPTLGTWRNCWSCTAPT